MPAKKPPKIVTKLIVSKIEFSFNINGVKSNSKNVIILNT